MSVVKCIIQALIQCWCKIYGKDGGSDSSRSCGLVQKWELPEQESDHLGNESIYFVQAEIFFLRAEGDLGK